MPITHATRQTEALRAGAAAGRRRFEAGAAGDLWRRLMLLDVVNQAMLVAATLLVCAFPFLMLLDAIAGRSFAMRVVRRMGLDQQAAAQVEALFKGNGTQTAVSIGTTVIVVLSVVCVVTSIQSLYARVYGFDPLDLHVWWRRLLWLAVTIVGGSATAALDPAHSSRPALAVAAGLVVATLYFWWSLRVLLEDRLSWRYLWPSAVATGLCWIGLAIVSHVYFSRALVSAGNVYGPIGVFFVILMWLISVGVVVALGAVVGVVWRERHA